MTSHNDNNNDQDIDEDLLREHVFDGIQEYDNKLPNWWLMTLYGAIVFSIAYWFFYHISGAGLTPEEKLAATQERAAAHAAESGDTDFSNDRLFAMSLDAQLVGSGESAYASNCAACHGSNAEGAIGPSFQDDEWIYGSEPTQILRVINEGVPAKGMPAWGSVLGEQRTAEIAAFIISLNPDAFAEFESGDAEEDESTL